jgi:hypothetical protein
MRITIAAVLFAACTAQIQLDPGPPVSNQANSSTGVQLTLQVPQSRFTDQQPIPIHTTLTSPNTIRLDCPAILVRAENDQYDLAWSPHEARGPCPNSTLIANRLTEIPADSATKGLPDDPRLRGENMWHGTYWTLPRGHWTITAWTTAGTTNGYETSVDIDVV